MKMLPVLDINEAVSKGDFNLLRSLVVSGADVNLHDKEGRTALMICCLHDGETWALGSARLLLTYGAKLSLCDKVGRNALMYAVLYNRESLVKLFLNALDCDLTHTDKWKHTVLWYTTITGNVTITTLLQEVFKKYRLDIRATSNILAKKCNLLTHQDQKKSQIRHSKVNRIQYAQPYKTIPALVWEKRATFYNATKSKVLQMTFKLDYISINQEKSSSSSPKESLTNDNKTNLSNSQDTNWRQDLQKLTATLEMQLSASYCRKARLLTSNIKRYPKLSKCETERPSEDELQRKTRNRRLSVDVLDVLQSKKATRGIFRRRCSVAVIPLIRIQSSKSSFNNEQEQQKIKNLLS
ncbi:hypothetical protein GDO81_001439 [Engystomops pustulosus]|uniref:Ankyrin repeat domain-containing protein 63 n=1 Tax=Engystomops pustulosus TaxID=76066 RepID=A0AAV7DCC6_ENGPU|nr:hypothetical protein GDO81_001439 [Engystomops pustulosus]